MIVAMQEHANRRADPGRDRTPGEHGICCAPHDRRSARRCWRPSAARIDFDTRDLEVLPGVAARPSHQRRLTSWRDGASGPKAPSSNSPTDVHDRRQRSRGHGRPMLGRIARAALHRGRAGCKGRRAASCAAARSSRAARPTPFRAWGWKGSSCCAKPGDRLRPAGHQRGHGDLADRSHAALRRHLPGGRAQHAELQPAARAGQGAKSRCC